MKQKYRLGIRLYKFFVKQEDVELIFFYNQDYSEINVIMENEDLEFQCVFQIPIQYFQKFQQEFKDKIIQLKERNLKKWDCKSSNI
ncbi:MAG: hypothetical protein ACFFA0_09235 [Promethearchaeota archaeon]